MTDADNLNKTFNDQIRNEKYRGITYFNSRFDWSESQLDWLIKMGINPSIAVIIANEKFTPSEINQKLFNLTFDFNQDDWKNFRTEKYWNNIDKINKLYDEGNTIVYWTARGSRTKINWYDLTKKQLDEWGVKYHELFVDKPYYDLFIDDKTLRIEEI